MTSRIVRNSRRPEQGGSHAGVDHGAFDDTIGVHELLRSMRDCQESRAIRVGWHALLSVEPDLEQAGTHFELWCLARDRANVAAERPPERCGPGCTRRASFLEDLHFQFDAVAPYIVEDGGQSLARLFVILFGVHAAIDREYTAVWHDIEARAGLDATADQQD